MVKELGTIVVLGGHRDEGAKHLQEAAAAAGANVEFTETASELVKLADQLQPIAAVVRRDAQGAASACVHARSQAKLSHVPILGEAKNLDEIAFVELFGWGGDDLLSLASPRPLVRRLRALAGRTKARPSARRPREGHAVVAGEGAQFRTVMARALFNGGFSVRFVASAAEAVEESRARGVTLVVASDGLRPDGAVAALDAARARGSDVPWVIVAPPKRFMATRAAVAKGRGKVAVADAFAPPENALFVANELLSTRGVDLRSSARLLYGTTVAFRAAGGRDDDEVGFTYNVSENGLYVRTLAPVDVGQEVWLELWPPRSERRVRLVGTVAWRRAFGPSESATVPPGLGVRITGGLGDDLARWRAGYAAFGDALMSGLARCNAA
jgi:DNA-binding response OmpR family regulator